MAFITSTQGLLKNKKIHTLRKIHTVIIHKMQGFQQTLLAAKKILYYHLALHRCKRNTVIKPLSRLSPPITRHTLRIPKTGIK